MGASSGRRNGEGAMTILRPDLEAYSDWCQIVSLTFTAEDWRTAERAMATPTGETQWRELCHHYRGLRAAAEMEVWSRDPRRRR
jgi:hypothetical protein